MKFRDFTVLKINTDHMSKIVSHSIEEEEHGAIKEKLMKFYLEIQKLTTELSNLKYSD